MKKGNTTEAKNPETVPDAERAAEDQVEAAGSGTSKGKSKAAKSRKASAREVKKLEAELAEKSGMAESLQDRLLRLQADFDNYRKRVVREKEAIWQRANAELIEDVLPALDHMELALKAADEHDAPEAFTEGFRLVLEQMVAGLKKHGLDPMGCDGAEFDPNLHEAIAHTPSDDVAENHVIVTTRRGYLLGERLLRAAQVVVSSGSPGPVVHVEVEDAEVDKTKDEA